MEHSSLALGSVWSLIDPGSCRNSVAKNLIAGDVGASLIYREIIANLVQGPHGWIGGSGDLIRRSPGGTGIFRNRALRYVIRLKQ